MLYDSYISHLEKLENGEKSGNLRVVREKSGKVCSCIWSITAIIDSKYAKKELFTR